MNIINSILCSLLSSSLLLSSLLSLLVHRRLNRGLPAACGLRRAGRALPPPRASRHASISRWQGMRHRAQSLEAYAAIAPSNSRLLRERQRLECHGLQHNVDISHPLVVLKSERARAVACGLRNLRFFGQPGNHPPCERGPIQGTFLNVKYVHNHNASCIPSARHSQRPLTRTDLSKALQIHVSNGFPKSNRSGRTTDLGCRTSHAR